MRSFSIVAVLIGIVIPLDVHVSGDPSPEPEPQDFNRPEQELITRYLLRRLLDKEVLAHPGDSLAATERIDDDQDPQSSVVYPQASNQREVRKLLDLAKENIDVIDFRGREGPEKRHTRTQDGFYQERQSGSEAIPTFIPFPGTEPTKVPRAVDRCSDCVNEVQTPPSRFSMPLTQLGKKKYYLGIFFKANWYKAEQYCRFHGMHLASINSEAEQNDLENHIESYGMGHEHFWTSGTDQAEEGKFFWMATGKPLTYDNWNAGEPNNFRYENGEEEHCLELWNRDGKGLRWNDTPCSFETFFVCEV